MGHEVTVATSYLPQRGNAQINGVHVIPFRISGNFVEGMSGDIAGYRRFVLNGDFDVLLNYAAQQWATDALFPILGEINRKKVFVPCGFSGLHLPHYQEYFRKMHDWIRMYDACVFASTNYRDVDFARRAGVHDIRMIPNGAAADEFLANDLPDIRHQLGIEDDFLILSVGSHTGLKGHREAIRIFERSKIREAVLLIVGNDNVGGCTSYCKKKSARSRISLKLRANRKRIIVKPLSRKETIAAYSAADLFLFTSNIECSPIVLYEAMASKTAFLTSDVGNAKEIIDWSNGGILMPTVFDERGNSNVDVNGGAVQLEKLWKDRDLRENLSKNGFRAWQNKFTWEHIAGIYEQLYSDLVKTG